MTKTTETRTNALETEIRETARNAPRPEVFAGELLRLLDRMAAECAAGDVIATTHQGNRPPNTRRNTK